MATKAASWQGWHGKGVAAPAPPSGIGVQPYPHFPCTASTIIRSFRGNPFTLDNMTSAACAAAARRSRQGWEATTYG